MSLLRYSLSSNHSLLRQGIGPCVNSHSFSLVSRTTSTQRDQTTVSIDQTANQSLDETTSKVKSFSKKLLSVSEIQKLTQREVKKRRDRLAAFRRKELGFLRDASFLKSSFPESIANLAPTIRDGKYSHLLQWPNKQIERDPRHEQIFSSTIKPKAFSGEITKHFTKKAEAIERLTKSTPTAQQLMAVRSRFSPVLNLPDYTTLLNLSCTIDEPKLGLLFYEDAISKKKYRFPPRDTRALLSCAVRVAERSTDHAFPSENQLSAEDVCFLLDEMIMQMVAAHQPLPYVTATIFSYCLQARITHLGDSPDVVESLPFTVDLSTSKGVNSFAAAILPVLQRTYGDQQYQALIALTSLVSSIIRSFNRSIIYQKSSFNNLILCLELVVAAYIHRGDYAGALSLIQTDSREIQVSVVSTISPTIFTQTLYSLIQTNHHSTAASLFDAPPSKSTLYHVLNTSSIRLRIQCLMQRVDASTAKNLDLLLKKIRGASIQIDAHCCDTIVSGLIDQNHKLAQSFLLQRFSLFPQWTAAAVHSLARLIDYHSSQGNHTAIVDLLLAAVKHRVLPLSVNSFESGGIELKMNLKQLDLPVKWFLAFDDPSTIVDSQYFADVVSIAQWMLAVQRNMMPSINQSTDSSISQSTDSSIGQSTDSSINQPSDSSNDMSRVWRNVDIDVEVDEGYQSLAESALKKVMKSSKST